MDYLRIRGRKMRFLSCAGELNHHGKFMCDSMYNILGLDFMRITTQDVNQERLHLGYNKNEVAEYNKVQINADKNTVRETVKWCDIMDFGAAPEIYLREAVRQNKIVFIRIERLFKEGKWKIFIPTVIFRYYKKYIRYRNNPHVYFLCVSAYAAADLAKIGIKGDRVLQWAYCPEFVPMKEEQFESSDKTINLLWCGRMIGWKHPEIAIKIALELKKRGQEFHLKMLGNGEKFKEIQDLIHKYNLGNEVELCGGIESSKVRTYMKNADIFLATSDQNEGWGVVINEAMNSGCVVFATPEMGAVPILIKNGINGFYIEKHNEEETASKIIELNRDRELLNSIKREAYRTIKEHFSPDIYAKRFIEIGCNVLAGRKFEYDYLGAEAEIR